MVQFAGCPPLRSLGEVTDHDVRRVAPFGDPGIVACLPLPPAFRRSLRPSSASGPRGIRPAPPSLVSPALWRVSLSPASLWRDELIRSSWLPSKADPRRERTLLGAGRSRRRRSPASLARRGALRSVPLSSLQLSRSRRSGAHPKASPSPPLRKEITHDLPREASVTERPPFEDQFPREATPVSTTGVAPGGPGPSQPERGEALLGGSPPEAVLKGGLFSLGAVRAALSGPITGAAADRFPTE